MKKILILILTVVIWRAKILLTGELIPKIGFIKKLVGSVEWLNSSHIVQLSMLIIAILLIIIIGKGKFSNFGFKGAPVKTVLRSVFLSFGVSIVLFLAFGIYMNITSSVVSSQVPFLEGSFLSRIILVWIMIYMQLRRRAGEEEMQREADAAREARSHRRESAERRRRQKELDFVDQENVMLNKSTY